MIDNLSWKATIVNLFSRKTMCLYLFVNIICMYGMCLLYSCIFIDNVECKVYTVNP